MEKKLSMQVARTATKQAAAPVVFLSYSHAETEIVLRFRDALSLCGLEILIDVDHLRPGEDISEFARRSVRVADATICIVSAASLASSWVVFEAVTTLHKEHTDPTSRLIACATDDSFFKPEFLITATGSLDRQLESINRLLSDYLVKGLDLGDLSVERSRFMSMRSNLGQLLVRLRSSLTLALTLETLAQTAARVADHIRESRGLAPSRNDPRDIRGRAEELRLFLSEDRTDDALDRLLDFVREFSDDSKNVREATFLANTLRRIERFEKERNLSFEEAEKQRQVMIRKLLELIDEVEVHPQLAVAG